MVREELVSSAVSFLQDPSVAASTLDRRVAFLQSKNLTQEEIDLALSRSGDPSSSQEIAPSATSQNQYGYRSSQIRQAPGYGYDPSSFQNVPWAQVPNQPRIRDWRDWFIMATLTTSIGYGLYTVAKRYVYPLIAPPTPPQLESDKAAIDQSFDRAFALIDQLASDTKDLKNSESERTERLGSALRNVDSVIEELKAANNRREAENRTINNEVQNLKELVPRALEGWKANGDSKLEDLSQELQSLRKLLENRVGSAAGNSNVLGRGSQGITGNSQAKSNESPSLQSTTTGNTELTSTSSASPSVGTVPKRGYGIPAWQKAAAEKSAGTSPNVNGEGAAEAGT